MKRCPFCAEQIQDEAIKCRWCGEMQRDPAREKSSSRIELHRSADMVVALHRGVCIATPHGPATRELIASLRGGLEQAAGRRGRFALLMFIGEGSDPPTGPAREDATAMFSSLRGHLRAISVVMQGSGFANAAKRSVFTWITSRIVGKTPIKTFNEVASAIDWLVEKCDELGIECPSSAQLRRDVVDLAPARR